MNTRHNVFEAIREILRDSLRCGVEVTPKTDLRSDAQLDSLDLLSLAIELENRFEIALDDETDLDCLRVDALVDRIVCLIGGVDKLDSNGRLIPVVAYDE